MFKGKKQREHWCNFHDDLFEVCGDDLVDLGDDAVHAHPISKEKLAAPVVVIA